MTSEPMPSGPTEEDETTKPGSLSIGQPFGARILIVEDDVSLGKFLSRALKLKSFSVNLPGIDGMVLLKQVRIAHPDLRILVLTARNRTEDMVSALEQGADDCLIKPFSFLELLARIRGLLRRESAPATTVSRIADLSIDREQHRVMRGERIIDLTPREFAILECLMNNAGKPVSRLTLMREVWNIPMDPSTNIVDVYMKYLRDKIDTEGEARLIRTIRGVGYVIRND
jgi:DNA-binding response OmpR family regulator